MGDLEQTPKNGLPNQEHVNYIDSNPDDHLSESQLAARSLERQDVHLISSSLIRLSQTTEEMANQHYEEAMRHRLPLFHIPTHGYYPSMERSAMYRQQSMDARARAQDYFEVIVAAEGIIKLGINHDR